MMCRRLLTALFVALTVTMTACGAVRNDYKVCRVVNAAVNREGVYSLAVSQIDFRHDLTRMCCTLSGRPNTACRIDSITLDGTDATDLDGVDMGRYFQFEEDGLERLEIDFPPMAVKKHMTLVFITSAGRLVFKLKR